MIVKGPLMNRYLLGIVLFLASACTTLKSQTPEEKAAAYHSIYQVLELATETNRPLLNTLGQMYRELPVTTPQDEKSKKQIAKEFEEKFHMSIDLFPIRAAGFFDKDSYKAIVQSVLEANIESVPQALYEALNNPKEADKIIRNAFISLSDAFNTYKRLKDAQEDLIDKAQKQLSELESKYPALSKLNDAIKKKFDQTYIFEAGLLRPFAPIPVGDLAAYIIEEYNAVTQAMRQEKSESRRASFISEINPILGLNDVLRIAFWLTQYEALKKPSLPALSQALGRFKERLQTEAIPLVDFYQSSLSREEHRNLLELLEKTLADRIKDILQQKETFCLKGECMNLPVGLENLIYYLARYASLQGPKDVLLVRKALKYINKVLTSPDSTDVDALLVPFVNSWDQLLEKMQSQARRNRPT